MSVPIALMKLLRLLDYAVNDIHVARCACDDAELRRADARCIQLYTKFRKAIEEANKLEPG